MSEWKVGDRVQIENGNVIRVGAVAAVESHQVERTKHDWYTRKDTKYMETEIKSIDVQWDDGELQKGLGRWSVNKEDSEMERSFRLAVSDAHKRIDEKLDEAWTAIRAAVKISEETGIPFYAGVSPLGQSYIPNSLSEKFPEVDREFYSEIAGASGEYEGWQHSAVC
jgi:hypothetical protein